MTSENTSPLTTPRIAGTAPVAMTLEPGKNYAWCSCGLSADGVLCDGAHKGTQLRPKLVHVTETPETVYFCTCKQTKNPPFCDGSHASVAQ
ncbi:MAG: CDGSH iron-sulfur domain-containing protein [Vampirovibrionales bacterium]